MWKCISHVNKSETDDLSK